MHAVLKGIRERISEDIKADETTATIRLLEWGGTEPTIHVVFEVGAGAAAIEVPIKQQTGDVIGASIWPSSVILSRHLLAGSALGTHRPALRILELGSGCGLAAMTLSLLHASYHVTATDKPCLLPLLRDNMAAFADRVREAGRPVGTVDLCAFDWFDFADKADGAGEAQSPETESRARPALPDWGPLDLIVLSDCLYSTAAVAPLVAVLSALLQRPHNAQARVLVANEPRSALEEFLSTYRRKIPGRPLVGVRTPARMLRLLEAPDVAVPVVVMISE